MLNETGVDDSPEEAVLPCCVNCNQALTAGGRFCSHCGAEQGARDPAEASQKWNNIRQILLFFLVEALICCVASFVPAFHTLRWSIIVSGLLAIVAVVFFVLNWTACRTLLVWHNFSLSRLLGYCAMAVAGSFVVSFFADSLNRILFSKHFSYYAFYEPHKHGKELVIFFVAVMPAVFEELAYRGFLLGKLLLVTEKKQAIFISAFLFAIMHTSAISLVWLIPFAILIGYVRVRQNTIWYGVCVHFCFNFTVCATEILLAGHRH
jgi:membrane protease YdiL (CAAX protease family)